MTEQAKRRATIARLNDQLRSTGEDGWTYLSRGVSRLPTVIQEDVIRAIRLFCDFTPDNDPRGEHDGAALTVGEHRIAWKIDYYTRGQACNGKVDPADQSATLRVMTIMFVETI
ncbi:DUF3768 domain-containing protein [Sphingopyxis macrogoltabida]|uniref:DUF3768 domain-containing protein n=1 Tax=Sphingopyxis macrogoltabida TaxID=33050 RepID=A0AAC8YX82_SPHMC|nr:DUF3768 domain-containing protein [Sphingopyxis macrogoltabida]ALJ11536.1 hypothetical protein LH19_01540 [Sphingopyxis macrogoltabida]AMU87727.1 hypothetical protein ATM17_01525 [Sphingopyxis macrogoltabida]